ncbi:hypothetical protein WAI453_002395 [Rhynchosporium graminicola]
MAQRTAPASQVPIVNIEALDTIDDGTFRITDQLTNDTKASGSEARGRGPDSNEDQTRSSGSIISESCYSIRSTRSYIRPYYRSRRVAKSEIEKPWIGERQSVWPTIIPCFGFACGLALMAVMIYLGVDSVPRHKYCLIMEDEFEGPTLNTSIWDFEVQIGGFGRVSLLFFQVD